MIIEFFESCIPPKTSHHAKRIVRFGGKTMLADKPELKAAKSFWDTLFLPHRPKEPLDGPLCLTVVLTWPWNAGDSKKLRATGRVAHDTAPDLSNVLKTIEDAGGRCAWFTNDARICEIHLSKYRGDSPGIYVRLSRQPCEAPAPQERELTLGLTTA